MLNQKGFSLVETIIAMVILAVGLLTLITMQTTGIKGNAKAGNITIASGWGADRLEKLFATDYEDADMKDKQATGAGSGGNGLDEVGGLADGTTTEGNYTIYWNIAENYVMPNTKTVRVHIVRNDMGGVERTVTMDYLKAKFM